MHAGIRDLCKPSLLQKEKTTDVRIFLKLTKARVHPLLIPVECKQEIPVLGETALYLLLFCYFYLCKTILSCITHLYFAITNAGECTACFGFGFFLITLQGHIENVV